MPLTSRPPFSTALPAAQAAAPTAGRGPRGGQRRRRPHAQRQLRGCSGRQPGGAPVALPGCLLRQPVQVRGQGCTPPPCSPVACGAALPCRSGRRSVHPLQGCIHSRCFAGSNRLLEARPTEPGLLPPPPAGSCWPPACTRSSRPQTTTMKWLAASLPTACSRRRRRPPRPTTRVRPRRGPRPRQTAAAAAKTWR